MTDRAADWARTLALIRARRVLLGLEDADERARTYLYVRALPAGETRQLAIAYLRAGLALGIPDQPSDLERLAGLEPARRPPDWLERLEHAANCTDLSQPARARAWGAIQVLDLIDPDWARAAYERLIRRCARYPVPPPLPVEVEIAIDLLHATPGLAEARAVVRAALTGQRTTADDRARALDAVHAILGDPWRSWIAAVLRAARR